MDTTASQEIPFDDVLPGNVKKTKTINNRCGFIKANGTECQSPVKIAGDKCRFHKDI